MRVFALLIAFTLTLFAQQWCVYYATQKKVYDNEDEIFKKRFEKATILHDGQYYRFLIGPYLSKKEALTVLKKAKRYQSDAFIRSCPPSLQQRTAKFTPKPSTALTSKKSAAFAVSNEPIVISEVFKRPVLKRMANKSQKRVVRKQQEVAKKKQSKKKDSSQTKEEQTAKKVLEQLEKEPFYRLSFYEFMNRFLYKSPYGNVESLDYRLKKLDALLEDVPYNWDLFLLGTARYSKFIDFNLAENKEAVLQGGVGLSKRLFDSGYIVKNNIKRLRKKLAKSNYLNTMDRLYLYGAQIYLNALTEQKIKELYEKNFFEQKAFRKVVQERYLAKVATRVDDIDAQDDLLNIKKSLLEKIYAYLYSDYLLRNSAELKVKKPLKLSWFGVSRSDKSLEEYYKNALAHSSRIERQRAQKAIEANRAIGARYFFLPQVDFNSLVYEEYRKDLSVTPSQTATGLNYQVGLNVKIPLYNRTNLDEKQRAKVRVSLERERLKSTIKDVMRDIHKTYNEIRKLRDQKKIVQEQLRLAKEKVDITKKRYVSGVGIYRDYSDAINEMLQYQEEIYNLDAQILMSQIYLNLLEGIWRPYEQN